MAFYLASTCFLCGLVLLFWYPKYPRQVRIGVIGLWAFATAIRTIFLLPHR